MTAAVIDDAGPAAAVDEAPADAPAPWWVRAAALAVDVVPGLAVAIAVALAVLTVPMRSGWWWSGVVLLGLTILLTVGNRLLLPAITGWSLGRATFGIAVQRANGAPVGPGRLLLRDLAHLVDTGSVFVGWLWPLWDQHRRTFADLLVSTRVRRVRLSGLPRNLPLLVALVFLVAALLCMASAAVGYAVVYQRDRAVDQARAQIAAQGPKIVEQMLSYDPESLQADFARAQSLATDKYREHLAAEQERVQKSKPVANQYWATNSSVLSAAPDRATMLLFLQGQRGEPAEQGQPQQPPERRPGGGRRSEPATGAQGGAPAQQGRQDQPPRVRFISATVRVAFAKTAAAQWRVDELTVVTKPLPAEAGN